jgi:hypothetical protein
LASIRPFALKMVLSAFFIYSLLLIFLHHVFCVLTHSVHPLVPCIFLIRMGSRSRSDMNTLLYDA